MLRRLAVESAREVLESVDKIGWDLPSGEKRLRMEEGLSNLETIQAALPAELRPRVSEAKEKLRLAVSPRMPEALEKLCAEFLAEADPAKRAGLADGIARFGSDGSKGWAIISRLYPQYLGEIEGLYPGVRSKGLGMGFNGSVFSKPSLVASSAESLRKLRSENPGLGADILTRNLHPSCGYAYFGFKIPAEPPAFKEYGRLLPYPIQGSPSSRQAGAGDEVVWVSQAAGAGAAVGSVRKLYACFDKVIDANFLALEALSAAAGSWTRSAAGSILSKARSMVRSFERFARSSDEDGSEAREAYSRIARRLRSGAEDPAVLVFKLDPEHPRSTLHSLINWMHQKALQFFSPSSESSFTGSIRSFMRKWSYLYFGDAPVSEALSGEALHGLMAAMEKTAGNVADKLFFNEDRIWLHATFGCHSAEIFADLSEPDEGGMLRIRYHESGYSGSEMRLDMIGAFLERCGLSVSIVKDEHLTATLDKDHGLQRPGQIARILPFILTMLHDTEDMDLMFGHYKNGLDRDEREAVSRALADSYFAEGRWVLPMEHANQLKLALKSYLEAAPRRELERNKLDAELVRLGLAPIPAGVPFGQRTIDLFFSAPIREAAARGEIRWDGLSRPSRKEHSPLRRLAAEAALSPKESGLAASLAERLSFEPIGAAGAFKAERALETLNDGSILCVLALREPSSGRLAFALASLWRQGEEPRPVGAGELKGLLIDNGREAGEEEEWSPAQAENLEALLRRGLGPDPGGLASAFGIGASPGRGAWAVGPVTFERKGKPGAILAVPYTSPDDLEAISKSAGVITTGGGALSHAAITTRELGLPAVILPFARWLPEGLDARLARRGPAEDLGGGIQGAALVPEPGPLREGDVVLVDGRSGELRLLARAGETPEVPPEPPAPPRRSEAGRSAPASDRVVLQGEPAVLRLDEIDGRYTEFVGGKSAKLGEMFHAAREADASVPEGIALTHFAYERFLEESGIKDRVEALARELDSGGDAQGLSKKIREVILSGRLSPEQGVGKRILDSLPPFEDWAVRSSAIQEDTDDAAFAGAAESYLFVKREDVLAKVVENWASFWLPRGIQYRRAHGLGSSELRPATLIQRMVQAEKSGVIFTRNPVTSADEIVINAVYGLGEGAVSGLAEADAYATRKPDGEEVGLAHVARKRRQVSPAGVGPVPKPLRSRRVLTRGQTRGLSKAALSLERHFGKALDVEFSIVDGRIVILQARPITTLD